MLQIKFEFIVKIAPVVENLEYLVGTILVEIKQKHYP